MTWARRFSLRQSARQSLWLVPLLGAIAGSLLAAASVSFEGSIDVPSDWDYSEGTAQAVLAAIIASMLGLVGFVVTVTVLMVQMATGTFSARYMRLLYRDGLLKLVLATLVGTFTYSLVLLRRVDTVVPDVGVTLAAAFVLVGIVLFLVFFSRFLQRLRPVAVASHVASLGMRTFAEGVELAGGPAAEAEAPTGRPDQVVRSTRSGTIQAVHVGGLVRLAERHDCTLAFRCAIGDFVSPGTALVEVRGAELSARMTRSLEGMVALGKERTIEQDPAFAIRIMVDIANRALSPAVNDPTSATQVLDYLEDVLLEIGGTDLGPRGVLRGGDGAARVLIPSRNWETYLSLALTEIRGYGATSVQVVRRLRALLLHLHDSVLPQHRAAVEDELGRLEATVRQAFAGGVDLDLASAADRQGLGGPPS